MKSVPSPFIYPNKSLEFNEILQILCSLDLPATVVGPRLIVYSNRTFFSMFQ